MAFRGCLGLVLAIPPFVFGQGRNLTHCFDVQLTPWTLFSTDGERTKRVLLISFGREWNKDPQCPTYGMTNGDYG